MMNTSRLYDAYLSSSGISTDTRNIRTGNIFFALKGDRFNGNRFAARALQDGAALAVIDEEEYQGDNTILVPDVLTALQDLARFHRDQLDIPVIGLTGSNGKTTTKELMHAVLSKKLNTLATSGNLNNHIGVPLTLLRITGEHEAAIIEMGANHQGEIGFLSSICQPDIGYITNFGKAHLEGFGGVEGVIKGKSELYTYLRTAGKKVLINFDDPIQREKTKDMQHISFGTGDNAMIQVRLSGEHYNGFLKVTFDHTSVRTQLTGQYNLSNISAAIALGIHFQVPHDAIKSALEAYHPTNNRSQLQKTERNELVIDTYNANPSSMAVALQNFSLLPGTKWAILGDMFELGEYEEKEHEDIISLAQDSGLEKLILVGMAFSRCKNHHSKTLCFATTEEALNFLTREKPSGKRILIKGSRGMKLEQLIPVL